MTDRRFHCSSCTGTGSAPAPDGGGRAYCDSCGAVIRWGDVQIDVHGTNAAEVESVARALIADATARQQVTHLRSPWFSGLFYLIAAAAMLALLLVAGSVLPPWTLPLVIVGALLLLTAIGALQLRHDDRLAEKGFLTLMRLVLERLPLLFEKSRTPNSPAD
jgi:hypothetical protein